MKSDKEKLITYGMYCNYIKDIKHYDSMQTHFRRLSSTILLASFAAIGFLFSVDMKSLPFERFFAVLLIMCIGSIALVVFWNVDLLFYEKQLISNFAEAYRLETENEWLPKVHHNMLYDVHKKDRPSNIVYFYIGCISSLILTTGIITCLHFYNIHHMPIVAFISLLTAIVIIILLFILLKKKTKKIEDLIKEIKYTK